MFVNYQPAYPFYSASRDLVIIINLLSMHAQNV